MRANYKKIVYKNQTFAMYSLKYACFYVSSGIGKLARQIFFISGVLKK